MPTLKTARARNLRKQFTDAENILWFYLRNRRFLDLKFRRQYSAGSYFIDFYCPHLKLGIEIDGGQHFTPDGKKYDRKRSKYITGMQITIVRYTNHDIIKNIKSVLDDLTEKIKERYSSPYPLLREERGGYGGVSLFKEKRDDYGDVPLLREERDDYGCFSLPGEKRGYNFL
jgi:very-short-patch-repair endonuclease